MAGTKAFDEGEAAGRLMGVFWERGYEGASIADLEAATGLRRGSLYNAFGDKAAMFATAFARYGAEVEEALLARLDPADAAAGVREMLRAMAEGAGPALPTGCLVARSAAELGARDDPLGEAVRARLRATEDRLAEVLAAAGAAEPRRLARFVAGTMRALPLLARAGATGTARDMAGVAADAVARALDRPQE